MSKQASKTLIGGFVVGAAAIVVAGILIFGSGQLMADKKFYVLFFEGSVKGLTIGSPARLKGVNIGQVTDMKLLVDPQSMKFYNQVTIEVFAGKISTLNEQGQEITIPKFRDHRTVERLIEKGLRAKLDMTSFVTGQLYVAFDFYPDTEAQFTEFQTAYVELPTIPSDFEALAETIKKIPFTQLMEKTLAAVEGINALVHAPEIKTALVRLDETLQSADDLVKTLDTQIAPLSRELTETLQDTRRLVNNLDRQVPVVSEELVATLKTTSAMIDKTKESSAEIYKLLEENSVFRYNLQQTMSELSSAGRSIRILADYLEQHPEALLYGKPGGK